MVQPIASSSVTAVAPVAPTASVAPDAAEQKPTPPAAATTAAASPTYAGSMERAQNNHFVYTLKDTDTGRVVVVIPHVELRTDGVTT